MPKNGFAGKSISIHHDAMPFVIPDPVRKKRLASMQHWLAENKEEGSTDAMLRAVKLMTEEESFLRFIKADPILSKGISKECPPNKFAWAYLLHLLYARDMVGAAMMLWDRETFCAEPKCVQMIWEALITKRMICVIGGGGLGKSYSPSAYFILEYILDPAWTRVQLASATEEHLLGNMFADMIRLHSGASMVLPGKQDTESISLDKKRAQGIFTLSLPGGANGKSKIKGAHTKPRPAHALFGRRSRVFALIDECQEVPQNIFEEIPNRFSTVVGDDVEHLKFLICANPKDIFSQFGKCAKPKGGWETITRSSTQWESERGWWVISLDQTHHENYIARKVVFPGFATYDGVQARLRACDGNPEDARMYTYVYGKFPPQGTSFACIKQRHILASEGEWIFSDLVSPIAGIDPAFTSDRPAFAMGRMGNAVGWTNPAGEKHMLAKPKVAIQIDAVTVLPHGDTQALVDECLSRIRDVGARPEHVGIDQTGGGRGTADIMRHQWNAKVGPLPNGGVLAPICGVEYATSATTIKISEEDSKTPRERYDRVATEMWYAAAKLFEFDSIRYGSGVPLEVLSELAARRGNMQVGLGQKETIETKTEYKRRTGGTSPDLADATLVMIHAARMANAGVIPRARDTSIPVPERESVWDGFGQVFSSSRMEGMAGAGEMADMLKD